MKLTQQNIQSEAQQVREQIWQQVINGEISAERGWSRPVYVTIETKAYTYVLEVEVLMSYDKHIFTLDYIREESTEVNEDGCDYEITAGVYYGDDCVEYELTTPELMEFNKKEWRTAA